MADKITAGPLAQQNAESIHKDGFTGTGFTGKDGNAVRKIVNSSVQLRQNYEFPFV